MHRHAQTQIKKARFNKFRRFWYALTVLVSAKSSIVPAGEYENNGWRFAWFYLIVFLFSMYNVIRLQEMCQKLMSIRLPWDLFLRSLVEKLQIRCVEKKLGKCEFNWGRERAVFLKQLQRTLQFGKWRFVQR